MSMCSPYLIVDQTWANDKVEGLRRLYQQLTTEMGKQTTRLRDCVDSRLYKQLTTEMGERGGSVTSWTRCSCPLSDS